MSQKERSPLTTLCYIEKEEHYLMLHRVKKEVDVNKDKWIGVAATSKRQIPRRMSSERSKRRNRLNLRILEV